MTTNTDPTTLPRDKVLIVDDEPQVLKALTDELEDEFDVVTETSAKSALVRIQDDKSISVILCDQRMPDMTGDQLFAMAREHSPATRVMITGYADLEAVIRAVNNGKIFGYVSKPWNHENLHMTIVNAAERNRFERLLKRERQLFNGLMGTSDDSLIITDKENVIQHANAGAARMLGVGSHDDLIGRRVEEYLTEDGAETWRRDSRRILQSGESMLNCTYEYPVEETVRLYSTNHSLLRDEVGGTVGLVHVSRDITSQAQAEERLKASLGITTIAAQASTEDEAIGAALSKLLQPLGACFAEAWTSNKDMGRYTSYEAIAGDRPEHQAFHEESKRRSKRQQVPLFEKIWQSGKSEWIEDIEKTPSSEFARKDIAKTAGFRSLMAVPAKLPSGESLAVLIFYFDLPLKRDEDVVLFAEGALDQLGEILKRKRVEDQVRLREEQLQIITTHIDEAIWLTDGEFEETLYASPAVEKIWGFGPEVFYTDSEAAYISPVIEEDRAKVEERYKYVPKTPQRFSFRIRKPDGELRWIEERTFPVRGPDGSVLKIVGVSADVTDAHMTQQRLRDTEERLNLIVENIGDVFWLVDPTLKAVLYISPNAECVLGYNSQYLIDNSGLFFDSLVHLDDREKMQDLYHQYGTGKLEYDYRWFGPQGETLYLRDRTVPVTDKNGNVTAIAGITRDVSQEWRSEVRLKEWTERYEMAADAAVIGVWDFNVSTGELFWDDRMFKIFRVSPESFQGTYEDWRKLVHEDDVERTETELRFAIEREQSFDSEFRVVRPDGQVRHIKANGRVSMASDGSGHKKVVGANVDITEHRLAETQLLQMQKLDAIGQLTGGVAHDFNNLLTVMKGNLQLSLKQEAIQENEKLSRWLTSAFDAANRGADLTRRLLTFSRRQVLEPVVINPNDIVLGMHDLLIRAIDEDVELKTKTEKTVSNIRTDVGQLENALLNLVVNARDAMPNGGQLTIETANTYLDETYAAKRGDVQPGNYVMIAVTDTGTGIPPEVAEKIFEPFFTTKESSKGTGLGLSMVFGFVKQAGGHVSYYTEKGIGTTFRLYFPVISDGADQIQAGADLIDLPKNAVARHAKILLVDDDMPVRDTAKDVLEDAGYTVVCAESGRQALECLAEHEDIDLLFTDIVMPGGINGVELARECRALRPEIKVIFASGYAEEALRRTGIEQQPGDWIAKPYDITRLALRVCDVLEGGSDSDPHSDGGS